jgi:hypothetical protein
MDYETYERERQDLLEEQSAELEKFDNLYMSETYPQQAYMVDGIEYELVSYSHCNGEPCATFERREIVTRTLSLNELMLLEKRKKLMPI